MQKKSIKAHKTLLENVKSLKKGQHIGKVVRDEPKTARNEFELLKKSEAAVVDPKVGVQDLLKVLKHSSKHHAVGKQIRNVQTSKQPLKRPLEQNVRSAIRRKIAYEDAKKRLARWDAYVAEHRSAESQIFPLNDETIFVNTKSEKPLQTALKSDLMLEMEATEAKLRVLKGADANDKNHLNLNEGSGGTREEMIEKRRKLAYLRMRESQQSAKARLRNKIKSLKYRKLMRRQKMQEEMKKFELMKKINPELALEKLKELDKARIIERASLRHKNTGTWAKNLQVRSKFDNEARKDLHEQLLNSRKLTEKVDQLDDASDSEKEADENEEDSQYDPFNPWMKLAGSESNEKSFTNENWRKYWLTRNMNEQLVAEHKAEISELKKEKAERDENKESDEISQKTERTVLKKVTNLKKIKSEEKVHSKVGVWAVEKLEPTKDPKVKQASEAIDTIFDKQEEKINKLLQKKLTKIEKREKKLEEKKQTAGKRSKMSNTKKTHYTVEDLSFNKSITKPIIDEELGYTSGDDLAATKPVSIPEAKNDVAATATATNATLNDIDPNNIVAVKPSKGIYLDLAGNQPDEEENHLTLCEAFKDDDIVADFTREIEQERKPVENELELTMPGWGSWSGAGITKKPANSKRIIFKKPTEEKRRPENADIVHVNENVNKHLREHLVADVPFPFTDLDTYNASLRTPVGRNLVPETAFRMLTKPALVTRKGQIIKPAHESELVKKQKKNQRKFR